MNERDRRVIQQLRNMAVFSHLFAQGITPDELKNALLAQLAPYSLNHQALTRYVVEYMVPDAVSLGSIAENSWAMDIFVEALRVPRKALNAERAASLQCLFSHTEPINNALSIYWSQYHLQRGIDTLELEEFVHEALRLIGTSIEGPMKPLLYALVHQGRIARGRCPKLEEVLALKLGSVVDELIQHASEPSIWSLAGVRLSQWRNIAQHFSARVAGSVIVCDYNDGKAQIRLSRSELRQVLTNTVAAYKALKVAHSVVFFDCVDEMSALGMVATSELRPEAELVVLVSGLASQGFEVVETQYTPAQSLMVVQDLSTLDPNDRRVHSTQFVIPLFIARPAEQVVVEYRERDGTPSLRTTANRSLIEHAQARNDWNIVAEKCQITNLKASS